MDYTQYSFENRMEENEILIAMISDLPFDTFEEHEKGFHAFVQTDLDSEDITVELSQLREDYKFSYSKKIIKGENWNELWESNFPPILVDDFCAIRASFHPNFPSAKHEITLNPKMAFGTGHHETTFMVIQAMEKINFEEKKVFDYGCGTGILAILAAKLGAKSIVALDNELPSFENTLENCELNSIKRVKTYHGTLDDIAEENFEIILANINRNVIFSSLPTLHKKLKTEGTLLISGFLTEDSNMMSQKLEELNFSIENIYEKDRWICMSLSKK